MFFRSLSLFCFFFFFKQKTAYEIKECDWSSDVCSSDLFTYEVQKKPNGLAQAFVIGEEFIGNDKVALILGDNIFYGSGLSKKLQTINDPNGGIIFAYHVSDPQRYGVVEFDDNNKALSIEEKPKQDRKSVV